MHIIIFLKSDYHTYTLDVYNFYWEVKVEWNLFLPFVLNKGTTFQLKCSIYVYKISSIGFFVLL